jgi:hypothetical protein
MSVWVWIAIGAGSLIAFSLLVGLVIARILGSIGREVSHVLEAEAEAWATAPLTHATEERVGIVPDEVIAQPQTVWSREEEFVASGHPDRAGQPPRAAPPVPASPPRVLEPDDGYTGRRWRRERVRILNISGGRLRGTSSATSARASKDTTSAARR